MYSARPAMAQWCPRSGPRAHGPMDVVANPPTRPSAGRGGHAVSANRLPSNPGEHRRLIILDRDGVINRDSDAYIKCPAEWVPLPGSLEAIGRLKRAGWTVVIATNQSGIGRGLFDHATLQRIHDKLRRTASQAGGSIDAIYVCPHAPSDDCPCRKPRPGLLQRIAADFGRPLRGVPVVGDTRRDLQAAVKVGAIPVLVSTGKGRRTLGELHGLGKVAIYRDLSAVAQALLDTAHPLS